MNRRPLMGEVKIMSEYLRLVEAGIDSFSKREIDRFIAEAYVALDLSYRKELFTREGEAVFAQMGNWGSTVVGIETDSSEEYERVCMACLAGCMFVKVAGDVITEVLSPEETQGLKAFVPAIGYDYSLRLESVNLMEFIDGLRYLHEAREGNGSKIMDILLVLGYESPRSITLDGEIDTVRDPESILLKLESLILENPPLIEECQRLGALLNINTRGNEGLQLGQDSPPG